MKCQLDFLLYETRSNSNYLNESGKRIRTRRSSQFQKLIVIYNNVLFFCNESTKMNHKNNAFSTFRCISGVKHLIDTLFSNRDNLNKFCQIYYIDSTQKQLKRRIIDDTEGNTLDVDVLLILQRLMKDINLYAKAFKSCEERLRENSNLNVKILLKQIDLRKQARETHNKSIFDKIVAVIIMSKNMKRDETIDRDLLLQNIDESLITILYWQLCYMSLRYSLIYSHEEQN